MFSPPFIHFLWIFCQLSTLLEVFAEEKKVFSANVKENTEKVISKLIITNTCMVVCCPLSLKEKHIKHKLLFQLKQFELQLENTFSNLFMYNGCTELCLGH